VYLPAKFENTRKFAFEIISMLGSTYRCEQLFSIMKGNKSSARNSINDTLFGSFLKNNHFKQNFSRNRNASSREEMSSVRTSTLNFSCSICIVTFVPIVIYVFKICLLFEIKLRFYEH
jgi:hypothetical protein